MQSISISQFEKALSQLSESYSSKKYLVAVSGGVDSMVLAHLFLKSDLNFEIAHVNYHLREEASNLDQKLVEKFCREHQIPFHLFEAEKSEEKPGNSVQLWAREMRYVFFRKKMEKSNLDFLVTAHHLNDQLETFLINLSRGSGIKGLSGIPIDENRTLRPLLSFSKEEIYAFAEENSIEFREDESNQKNDYLRNLIRNEIVPKLMEISPNFLGNFEKSLHILHQTKDFVEEETKSRKELLFKKKAGEIIINKNDLLSENQIIRYNLLKELGFKNEDEMQKMFSSKTGSQFRSEKGTLIINRNEFIFTFYDDFDFWGQEIELEINSKNEIEIPNGILNEIAEFGSCEWLFDTEKIIFPLKLRRKKEGDSFFPIGMIGKKKIAKFFKDEKLSILAKQKIWLLCNGNDDVMGIIPLRQDRRFLGNKKNSSTLTIKL